MVILTMNSIDIWKTFSNQALFRWEKNILCLLKVLFKNCTRGDRGQCNNNNDDNNKDYIKNMLFLLHLLRATLCCVMHKILEKMWDASILEEHMICKYTEKQWKGSTIKCKNMSFC